MNLFLGLFNLLPIPPLDGSSLLERVLPERWLPDWYRFRPYGILVLFALVFFTGIFTTIIKPFQDRLYDFVYGLTARHLVRRFVGALWPGPPRADDEAWAAEVLAPEELLLFRRLPNHDRRHAARSVARRDRGRSARTREALDRRAMLHDVGKYDAGLSVPGRATPPSRRPGRRGGTASRRMAGKPVGWRPAISRLRRAR